MAVTSSQRVLRGLQIPPGHIFVHEKFYGSEIVQELQVNHVKVVVEESMGIADFHTAGNVAVMLVTENDLVSDNDVTKKLWKLAKLAPDVKGVVLAEKTPLTEQYYQTLQKTAVIDLGLTMIPVVERKDAAKILSQMVHMESNPLKNPFRLKRKTVTTDTSLLAVVKGIPGLGEKKALALLKEFETLKAISNASLEALAAVVGKSTAEQVKTFFMKTFKGPKIWVGEKPPK